MAIHERHLKLVLEVRHGSYAPDDGARPPAPRVVHEQAVETVHLDVRVLAEHLANDPDALIGGEQRLLVLVDQHRDDDALEQMGAAQDDVHVTVGQRIERSRKHREAAGGRSSHGTPLRATKTRERAVARLHLPCELERSGVRWKTARRALQHHQSVAGQHPADASSTAVTSMMSYGGSSRIRSNALAARPDSTVATSPRSIV